MFVHGTKVLSDKRIAYCASESLLTLDDAGVDQLCQVLVANGGTRVVGDLQRTANRNAVAAGRLRLAIHKQGAAPIIEKRGEKHFRAQHGIAAGAPLPFSVDVKIGNTQAAFTIPEELVAAIRSSVFESVAGVDPLVDALGEMMKVSTVVPHQLIGAAAVASPEMGAGSRQVVLCADRSVQVSTMPASSVVNPVLIVRPATQIIDPWPTNACRMESEGWQFAEANLIGADRRKYFEASVEVDAGSPSSISLTTAKDADTLCTDTFELEPLVKGMAAYPIEFDTSSFNADFEFEVDATSLTDWRDEAASKLRGTESLYKFVATGTGASLKADKHNLPVTQTGTMTAGQVYLRGTDFVAVAKAINGLDLTNNAMVSFEIDQDLAMRITFATSLTAYELYVPVVQAGSRKAFTHGFRQMVVA
jgi:hypothetical protein